MREVFGSLSVFDPVDVPQCTQQYS